MNVHVIRLIELVSQTLLIQRVANGFLAVPQHSGEEPMVFITLKELLTYVAGYIADIDTEFNAYEQQIEIVDKVHEA